MAEWGFDFARPDVLLDMANKEDWLNIDEKALGTVDQAIEWGRQHGIHVNLNFHRFPALREQPRGGAVPALRQPPRVDGACVGRRPPLAGFPRNATRDIPTDRLSFDLFNEPPWMPDQSRYVEIARALVAPSARSAPAGYCGRWGRHRADTRHGTVDLGLVQSTPRLPAKMVSHYNRRVGAEERFESFEKPSGRWSTRRACVGPRKNSDKS